MRNIFIAVFTILVILQQALNPIQFPIAETVQAADVKTVEKTNYNLHLNTQKQTALELTDTRPTFDEAVLSPLRTAQEAQAKAKAEAEAKAKAEAEARAKATFYVASVPKSNPLVIGGDDVWAKLRYCESGGDYTKNTGNGYYGAYQYNLSTWANYGGYARPDLAPPEVQDAKARQTQAARGWSPWPACARKLGLL